MTAQTERKNGSGWTQTITNSRAIFPMGGAPDASLTVAEETKRRLSETPRAKQKKTPEEDLLKWGTYSALEAYRKRILR